MKVIDYTKKPIGGKIVKCPKCGKNGELHIFKGRHEYYHKSEIHGAFNIVKEFCYHN